MKAEGSTVVITNSVVVGGRGWDAEYPTYSGGNAGPAIAAVGGSLLTVAGCATIRGGRAGWGNAGISWPPPDGHAGDGIRAQASTVLIRGELADRVEPGSPEYGTPGHAIVAEAGSQVAWSGVTLGSPQILATASTVIHPAPDEPFMEILGPGLPGTIREFHVHGPGGASALVVFGFPGPAFALPGFGSTFWISVPPVAVVSVVTAGYWPVPLPVTLPAASGLEGVSLSAQAAFPGLPSPFSPDVFVTNPATVVVRF
ncbi:MAG: hypothetical protein HY812_04565 [Planctomycetes bacterium]|nr:hypothetical protein [Planctomycetota bacterium]